MDVRNSAAESQNSDQSQPIQEMHADAGSKMDVDAAAGGAGVVEVELGNGGGGADMVKKKRGRPPRAQAQAKSPPAKMTKEDDEDVCFICFDGGSLVLCDRRGCPKAYHPACVKRDDAFFRSKAKWNCGWHICSMCQKSAHHMCYTCTYSLCKGCIRKAEYVSVRGDKGFCTVCMKTIMLIENGGQGKDEKAQVDFDDKTSWEYLFKVYWVYLKGKLSLTLDELTQAKNPWKGANTTTSIVPSTCVHNEVNDLKNISPDMSPQNLEASESKRRKIDEQISIPQKETNPKPQKETVIKKDPGTDENSSVVACKDWATKELLDFVAHMKNGDTSVLSQFDVQELMLEYIKINNLRDPRKKSQIVCDARLKILFGKPRVGHFEMLKLLEFHFFIKDDLPKNTITSIARHADPDWNSEHTITFGKDKKRRSHKKVEERAPQNNLDEYAAIDVHNMNLVYLRRKYMETLIENSEEFQRKVVGSIVRIRISGKDQKHDLYRLVQVVGTSKADAPYKIGDKSADVVLEVLNLDKKETVSIDTISNQDLSEDECRRLRQSIRCGLVKRFTVGEIQDKAVSLQSVRLNDWMEAEILRLNNLRDRASEKGHKKGLREYVEKLQLLKTPEERERRLREIPEVHSDPKMNPDYESDDTEEYFNKEHEQTKLKYSGISRKSTISSRKRADFSNNVGSKSWKNEEGSSKAMVRINMKKDAHETSSSGRTQSQVNYNGSTITNQSHNTASETASSSCSMKNGPVSNDNELDKVWHYRDPSGKVQGPFCMVQLKKWSTTGYFPVDLRIWRGKEDESLLLNDVLEEQSHHRNATEKVVTRIEGLTVRTADLSSAQNSVDHEKLSESHGSTGQSSVHDWIANGETPSFGRSNKSNESKMTEMASPTPPGTSADIKRVSSVFDIANADLVDLPSPTPKEAHKDEKVHSSSEIMVQEARNVGGAQPPETAKEWSGYSPTQEKRGEGHSEGDHTSANIDQVIPSSTSQPGYNNYMPPWQGVRETIEFSTLAEESVSDLLAEVDAMESQNGFPSPTSRRNSFVEDLFNGSFEEFSPTPDQGARSDAFSSNGAELHLPVPPTTMTTTTTTVGTSEGHNNNVFDFIKNSTDLQFKWPEMPRETISKDMVHVNSSIKADEGEKETNTGVVRIDEKSETSDREGGIEDYKEGECTKPTTTKSKDPSPELVLEVRTDHREAGNGTAQSAKVDAIGAPQPQPPQPLPPQLSLAIGLDKAYPRQGNMNNFGRPAQEIMTRVNPHVNTSRVGNVGWDPLQRTYTGERFNNNSPRERSYKVEDPGYGRNGKPWVRQPLFGSGGNVGGGFSRPPPKGQRVCKFYESGRCKKGASCNYWHP